MGKEKSHLIKGPCDQVRKNRIRIGLWPPSLLMSTQIKTLYQGPVCVLEGEVTMGKSYGQ